MAVTTFQINTNPLNGTLTGFNASTGSVIYTPNFGFSGGDVFTYNILCDGIVVDSATVAVTIAPYTADAVDDIFTTNKNTPITATVTSNDVACNATNTYYSLVPGFSTNGVTTMHQDGTFTFTPTTNTLQTGVFRYNIRCGMDFETSVVLDTATASIRIVGSTLTDDSFVANINQITVGKISANDLISCEGGVVTKTATDVKNGTMFSFNTTTGEFAFIPDTNFLGQTDFSVNVYCDLGAGPVLIGTQKVFMNFVCPGSIPVACSSKAPKIVTNGCLLEGDINLSAVVMNTGILNLFDKNKKLLASIPTTQGVTDVPISPARLGDAYYFTFTETGKTESAISNIATVCKAPEPKCCPPPKKDCCTQYDEQSCCH